MSKLQTYRVNKIPFEGPVTFKAITEQIAQDAKENGIDISAKNIAFVIQHVFSIRGALESIPYFIPAFIKGFGRWIPNKDGVKLRKRYYRARAKYNAEYKLRLRRAKAAIIYSKILYAKYLETSTAEIQLSYYLWKKASGRKKIIDKKYNELNQLRRTFHKREKNTFNYVTTILPYRVNKSKRR